MLNTFPPRLQWLLEWPIFQSVARLSRSQRKQQYFVYPVCRPSKRATTIKSPQSCHWCWLEFMPLKSFHVVIHFIWDCMTNWNRCQNIGIMQQNSRKTFLWWINEQSPLIWIVNDVKGCHHTIDGVAGYNIAFPEEEWDSSALLLGSSKSLTRLFNWVVIHLVLLGVVWRRRMGENVGPVTLMVQDQKLHPLAFPNLTQVRMFLAHQEPAVLLCGVLGV